MPEGRCWVRFIPAHGGGGGLQYVSAPDSARVGDTSIPQIILTAIAADGGKSIDAAVAACTLRAMAADSGAFADSALVRGIWRPSGSDIGKLSDSAAATGGQLPSFTYDHYVSTTGRAGGPGTIDDPWTLAYAAAGAGGQITAGDHIGVRGGDYATTARVTIAAACAGQVGSGVDAMDGKVIFRNYHGEPWRIIGSSAHGEQDFTIVRLEASYCWVWGVEGYYGGWTTRQQAPHNEPGFYVYGASTNGAKFIHCVAHDVDDGFVVEDTVGPSEDTELYGCLSYNCGVNTTTRGHGLYNRHIGPGRLRIRHHISFAHFGYNFQLYADTKQISYIDLDDCLHFNGGARYSTSGGAIIWGGGSYGPNHCGMRRVYGYVPNTLTGLQVGFGYSLVVGTDDALEDNYHVGPGTLYNFHAPISPQSSLVARRNFGQGAGIMVDNDEAGLLGYVWEQNTWRRNPGGGFSPGPSFDSWRTATGLGTTDTCVAGVPTETLVVVKRADKYEPGRGHLCYYDWANLSVLLGYIPADVSQLLAVGDHYTVSDVRDLATPVLTGTYDGTALHLPITERPMPLIIGGPAGLLPPATAPFYNAFILRKE